MDIDCYVLKLKSDGRYLASIDCAGLTVSPFFEQAICFNDYMDACEMLTIIDNLYYLEDDFEISEIPF